MRFGSIVAAGVAALALAACGSSANHASVSGSGSAGSVQAPAASDGLQLVTGPDTQQISQTIVAFYRATWENQGTQACSLFSPAGATGFVQSAKVAFPASVNQVTTCADAMRFFNADLADSADTLQQSGVNVSGAILDHVGVSHIQIHGDRATAQAPEGVEEFIAPKTFLMVRENGRWLIDGSRKIGQTLPQLLAAAKAKHELVPKTTPAQH